MSSTKPAELSSASITGSYRETESQAQAQIQKSVYKGPPVATSVIDFSTIPVSLDVLSYPLEDEIMRALYQKRAREAEWCGPPADSLVIDFGSVEDCRRYYGQRALVAECATKSEDEVKRLFDKRCVAEKKTKKMAELSKNKDKDGKKVWTLYGKLKIRM